MASSGDAEVEDAISSDDHTRLDENGFPYPESDFALEFYSAGSDWSRLLEKDGGTSKDLVQKSLFQMWGISKPAQVPEPESRVAQQRFAPKRRRAGGGSMPSGDEGQLDGGRACPFYKKIAGTPFTVDAFRYGCVDGCSAYFLSHFHADHYGGLTKKWSHGPIYCTSLTARLVKLCLSVNQMYIRPLELDTEYVIEGVKVMLLDANHCPGAALIHFHLADGRRYLHTGDFRASKLMQSHTILDHPINVLYLDTTYCNPKYRFPSKEDVVHFVVQISQECLKKKPKTLIVVGAYSIGKEHVYVALSQALGVKIHANYSRRRILESFGWPELSGKLCSNGSESLLHVLPMSYIRHEHLKEHVKRYDQRFETVLAFRPTGWTYSETIGNHLDMIRPNSKGNVTIYGVPYSEHSSFIELRDFVKFLKPGKIIPTVNNGNKAQREKMQSLFQEWLKA